MNLYLVEYLRRDGTRDARPVLADDSDQAAVEIGRQERVEGGGVNLTSPPIEVYVRLILGVEPVR